MEMQTNGVRDLIDTIDRELSFAVWKKIIRFWVCVK